MEVIWEVSEEEMELSWRGSDWTEEFNDVKLELMSETELSLNDEMEVICDESELIEEDWIELQDDWIWEVEVEISFDVSWTEEINEFEVENWLLIFEWIEAICVIWFETSAINDVIFDWSDEVIWFAVLISFKAVTSFEFSAFTFTSMLEFTSLLSADMFDDNVDCDDDINDWIDDECDVIEDDKSEFVWSIDDWIAEDNDWTEEESEVCISTRRST